LKVPEIKLAIEKKTKATIKRIQPDAKLPPPTLDRLDAGLLEVPAGHIVFMVSYAPEDCTQAVLETRADIADDGHVVDWPCGSGVVLFEGVFFRTKPPGIPYASIPMLIEEVE
jgi:hypothetical protein